MTGPYQPTSHLVRQMTQALIDHLDTAGFGVQQLPGDPPPANPAGLPLITAKAQPAKPDRIIAVTVYAAQHDLQLRHSVLRAQLWTRGKPNEPLDADNIADPALTHLHGLRHAVWNGLEVALVEHLSMAQLGPDEHGRYARSDNYQITTQRRTS